MTIILGAIIILALLVSIPLGIEFGFMALFYTLPFAILSSYILMNGIAIDTIMDLITLPHVLFGALIYLAIGVVWSILKWFIFLFEKKREIEKKYNNDLIKIKNYFATTANSIPVASSNKSLFSFWTIYWPLSMIWTLINNPVRRIFNVIFNFMTNTFNRMSKAVFSNYID